MPANGPLILYKKDHDGDSLTTMESCREDPLQWTAAEKEKLFLAVLLIARSSASGLRCSCILANRLFIGPSRAIGLGNGWG